MTNQNCVFNCIFINVIVINPRYKSNNKTHSYTLGCGDFVFFSPIFAEIADLPWVTQTKTMVFLKSAVA